MPDDTAKVRQLIKLSNENLLSNSSLSLDYAQQAVNLAERLGEASALTEAFDQITLVTFHSGLYEISASYMNRQLVTVIERQDYMEMSKLYFNLGSLRHLLNDFAGAESDIMKGWKMRDSVYKSLGKNFPKEEQALVYNNLGYLYWSMNELVDAEKYYKLGLQLGSKEDVTSRNYKNMNLGLVNVYFKKQEYGNIKPILDEVLILQKQENDITGIINTLVMEGDLFEVYGNYLEAIDYYAQAWSLANTIENLSLSQHVAEALYDIYEKQGVADSALKYLNQSNALKEQMKITEARQEIMRAELVREYQAREEQLTKASRSTFLRLSMLIGIILVVSIALVWLYVRYRRKYQVAEEQRLHIEEVAEQTGQQAELLKADLERKDKELTTQVIYSIQKNEMISELVDKLQSQNPEDLVSQADELRKIIKALEKTTDRGVWEEFELRFQQVHTGFYERLQAKYPNLTLTERRLCAFLRLDMTTKEIASITGQTVRAVEIGRNRLRKKLNLTHSDQKLFDVISAV